MARRSSKGYKWRKFIDVSINDKQIKHFKRDIRTTIRKLAITQDVPVFRRLGDLIVAEARSLSPDEWKPGTGNLKANIKAKVRTKNKERILSVTSSAKRKGIPYAKIQEEGLPKSREAKSKPFMVFPQMDGVGYYKVQSTARFIKPSRYMEQAVNNVLRKNAATIDTQFRRWNRERLKVRGKWTKENKVNLKRISGATISALKEPSQKAHQAKKARQEQRMKAAVARGPQVKPREMDVREIKKKPSRTKQRSLCLRGRTAQVQARLAEYKRRSKYSSRRT